MASYMRSYQIWWPHVLRRAGARYHRTRRHSTTSPRKSGGSQAPAGHFTAGAAAAAGQGVWQGWGIGRSQLVIMVLALLAPEHMVIQERVVGSACSYSSS